MSEKELDDWEAKNSFQSFRSVFKKAQAEWNNLTDMADTVLLLDKYKDILKSENGYLIPNIPVSSYQILCNRYGFYETGGVMNRLSGFFIYSIIKTNSHKLVQVDNIDPRNGKDVIITKYIEDDLLDESKKNLGTRTEAICSYGMTVSFFDNPSGCKNDRIAYTKFQQFYVAQTDYITLNDGSIFYRNHRQTCAEVLVWGSKKNWLCAWNDFYSTLFDVRNASFTISAFKNTSIDFYGNDAVRTHSVLELLPRTYSDFSTSTEADRLVFLRILYGDIIINELIELVPPTRVHIEGKTRGTTGWAIIDCQ